MEKLTEIWTRNSFDVEAVQVTEENMGRVASWCRGTLALTLTNQPEPYIALNVTRSNKHRYVKVWVGDWITQMDGAFKTYRNKSFRFAYQPKKNQDKFNDVLELVREAMDVQDPWTSRTRDADACAITQRIIDLFNGEEKEAV